MKFAIVLAVGILVVPIVAAADDFVVSAAAVTQVNMVDPGFRTFQHQPLSQAQTVSLTAGESKTVDVFKLYTDEKKVNDETDDDEQDDHVPKPITATVTLGAPVNQTLTFSGTTKGNVDFNGVPANIQAILDKEEDERTNFELFQVGQWGLANQEAAKAAGGRGVVEWTGTLPPIDLGAGKSLTVKLEDGLYNEGLQFGAAGFGPGTGNAGTVMATLTLTQAVVEMEKPRVTFVVLQGAEIKFTMQTRVGYSYTVEKRGSANWETVPGVTAGNGEVVEFTVPKQNGARDELIRVRETKNP